MSKYGPSGPSNTNPLAALTLPESFRVTPPWCIQGLARNDFTRMIRHHLTEGLTWQTELAVSCVAELTNQIRNGAASAQSTLAELQGELRRSWVTSQYLMSMIDMLMPSKESPSQVMADYDTMRVGGEFFPCNVRTFLMRHAARGSGLPFEDRPEIQVRLAAMLDILDKSSSRIVTIHDSLRRPREQMSPFEIIMSTVLTKEGVDDISRTIMLHHRTPGDPAIREKGAVIADVSPQLVRSDLAEGSQVILVVRGPALVGLAFFFPPERIPSHFSTLNARFPETSNAALLQVLVAPSAQGSGVFDCVMNATLTALQSCGAQLLIGEVEHTNERAQRAYQKYNGSLHTTYRSESLSPSGISTSFIGLSIPISGTEHEQSYFRNAIDAR